MHLNLVIDRFNRRNQKRQRKKPFSGKLAIHVDHQRCSIEIPFGMVGGFPAVSYKFQASSTWLSGYRAVRGRNLADLIT